MNTKIYLISNLLLCIVFSSLLLGCGGSSNNSSGILIEGQLTQGESAAHDVANGLEKIHGAGENIESVEICALGECSTTDSAGNWGFIAPESFNGGDVSFSIAGHGIDASAVVSIPQNSQNVFIHFEHGEANEITLHHFTVDGVEVEQHDEDQHE